MSNEPVQIGDCLLYCGDCLEILPTLEAGSVDAVVTDPPYGIGLGVSKDMRGNGHGLAKPVYNNFADTYEDFIQGIVPRLNAALDLVPRAAAFTGPHIVEQRKADAMGGIYCSAGAGRHRWGFKTFLPVLFYGTAPDLNKGAKPIVLASNARAEKNGHPCPKPLEWMLWLVGITSRVGETILDPFMGSGTTGVACVNTGRKFIGIERDEKYFAIACDRIRKAYAARPALLEAV